MRKRGNKQIRWLRLALKFSFHLVKEIRGNTTSFPSALDNAQKALGVQKAKGCPALIFERHSKQRYAVTACKAYKGSSTYFSDKYAKYTDRCWRCTLTKKQVKVRILARVISK